MPSCIGDTPAASLINIAKSKIQHLTLAPHQLHQEPQLLTGTTLITLINRITNDITFTLKCIQTSSLYEKFKVMTVPI